MNSKEIRILAAEVAAEVAAKTAQAIIAGKGAPTIKSPRKAPHVASQAPASGKAATNTKATIAGPFYLVLDNRIAFPFYDHAQAKRAAEVAHGSGDVDVRLTAKRPEKILIADPFTGRPTK